MPTAVPNYLTIDPATGAVGADFTGHVHAQGIDLDAPPTNALFDEDNTVRWVRQSDGALIAQTGASMAARDSGDSHNAVQEFLVTNPDHLNQLARFTMGAYQAGGGNISFSVNNGAQSAGGLLMAADGESSFVQNTDNRKTVLAVGNVNLTFPVGGAVAHATVAHGLGVTPSGLIVTPSVRADGGVCWGQWNNRTPTTFEAYAITSNAPGTAGVVTVASWIAVAVI